MKTVRAAFKVSTHLAFCEFYQHILNAVLQARILISKVAYRATFWVFLRFGGEKLSSIERNSIRWKMSYSAKTDIRSCLLLIATSMTSCHMSHPCLIWVVLRIPQGRRGTGTLQFFKNYWALTPNNFQVV